MAFFSTPQLFNSRIKKGVFYGLVFPAVLYFTGKAIVSICKYVYQSLKPSAASRRASPISPPVELKYEGDLEEVELLDAGQQPVFPRALENIVLEYLACDAGGDLNQYSEKQLAAFKLFGMPIALTSKIARYIASGERTKALEFIRKYPSTLHCVAEARDGFGVGRRAAGTPLRLAIAMSDTVLRDEIIKLLPAQETKAQIQAHFSAGWEEEQKERDARYINAATRFRDQLQAKRLSGDMTLWQELHMPWAQALKERRACILEYKEALRPKPDDPVTTRGFMVNPQIYLTVRKRFLESEDELGGLISLDVDFLWTVGFQSLLEAGPPALGQILMDGANQYGKPGYVPPKVLAFVDGTPFYEQDPLKGFKRGSQLFGAQVDSGAGAAWARRNNVCTFFKDLCRATTSIQPSLCSFRTDGNDAGISVELRRKSCEVSTRPNVSS